MEAVGVAAGARALSSFENAVLGRKCASVGASSSPSTAHRASTSAADCCVGFRVAKKVRNLCAAGPLGLAGDGLSGKLHFSPSSSSTASSSSSSSSSSSPGPSFSRRGSRKTSQFRSAAAMAPVQSLEGTSLLKDIDSHDLEAETPSLLQQCSDLDWKKLVDDLRSEALHGLQSAGLRALSLKALEKLMGAWIHEQMVEGIESPMAAGEVLSTEEPGWNLEAAASNLRMEANLQAAQMLASGVDSSFDWETDVAELHQRILQQGGAEPGVLRPEQRLWQSWVHAQSHVFESSHKLTEEALSSASLHEQGLCSEGQTETLDSKPESQAGVVGSSLEAAAKDSVDGNSLLSVGAAVATGLAVEGMWLSDALADEIGPDALEAVSRAPSWLVPAVLIFPPLSYLLFNVYRDKVNPYAKVTDWMFGVVALTIVSNIVMMAVWGVRLY